MFCPVVEDLSVPEVAAVLRAQHRKDLDGLHRAGGSIHDDVAAAEAAYDEPDELWTEDGIPIEPFHLKREREEGYFDVDGNYVEYALKDADDAWLSSLAGANSCLNLCKKNSGTFEIVRHQETLKHTLISRFI